MSNHVYKFNCDCGRMGSLSGVFVADEADVAKLIGTEIYFGEVLGKHSEISVTITAENCVEVPASDEVVAWLVAHLNGSTGHNPLHYRDEEF